MVIDVIITGARGRMGNTNRLQVESDSGLNLYGLLEREDQLGALEASLSGKNVLVGHQLEPMLRKFRQDKGQSAPGPIIIDFTAPAASLAFAATAAEYGAGMVIGTTGLDAAQKADLGKLAEKARIFWSPNMSVGINALIKVLPQLSKILGADYDIEMVELHHKKKKDSPSGTALLLAECCAESKDWKLDECACYHREGIIGERPQKQIGVQTIRGGDVVGVHTVYFMGPGERIEVTHQAHSRENFSNGALRAVKWLSGRQPGKLYSMKDLLG